MASNKTQWRMFGKKCKQMLGSEFLRMQTLCLRYGNKAIDSNAINHFTGLHNPFEAMC